MSIGFAKKLCVAGLLSASLALAGCQNQTGWGTKETVGTLGGAALGGWAGSQIGRSGSTGNLAATAGLALAGAFLGNQIGASLDRADRLEAERTANYALESYPDGQTANWSNPNTGHSGYTTPTTTYQTASGQNCREYKTAVVIDGRTETATGTACRQADGSWKVVN